MMVHQFNTQKISIDGQLNMFGDAVTCVSDYLSWSWSHDRCKLI